MEEGPASPVSSSPMYTWREKSRKPVPGEIERFREFLPIGELTSTGFDKLVEIAQVSIVPQGHQLFEAGESDTLSIFLLQGQVELQGSGGRVVVNPGTDTARYALANLKPRRFTGRARTDVVVLHVDSRLLEKLVAWDQMSKGGVQGLHVEELDGGEDPEWFLHMLGNRIFMRVPTANVEALVKRFEPVAVKAGEAIIEQGTAGHDYFIIRQGSCEVLRQSGPDAQPVRIAQRHPGEGVGEEALLSDKPRDATVRMLTDGLVMKLSKEDFDALLKPPLLDWIDEQQVMSRMQEGAVLIDVRLEDEFKHGSLKDAVNIPLYMLRLKLDKLDSHKHYITFCDTGERSATAAFLLGARGLASSAIRGGINACPRLPTRE